MDQIPRISEVVFVRMSNIVGTPTQVSNRRQLCIIANIINSVLYKCVTSSVFNGSIGEGFLLNDSDTDIMKWPSDHHVLCDLNQADHYNTDRCTLILMEYAEDRPGFVKLQLLTPSNDLFVQRSCLHINGKTYISSALFRKNRIYNGIGREHGPSVTTKVGFFDCDYVISFKSKFWPPIVNSFFLRCLYKEWPNRQLLRDIHKSGCHVVPKGLKGTEQENLEWMISFSIAERKLVFSMNHTQFLCYGLLKLFVKEVLTEVDTDGEPLLCSYFMKTILFWVIQNNAFMEWNPSHLLYGFWLCFKLLLSCVYQGYLPNFFIPENNMFITKIYGHSQQVLYEHLYEMYNIGIACLLHCPSVRDCYIQAICNRQYVVSTVESDITQIDIDSEIFDQIYNYIYYPSTRFNMGYLFSVYSMLRCLDVPYLNIHERIAVRYAISRLFRQTSFFLYETCLSGQVTNKHSLRATNACLHMMKVSAKLGCLSDMNYVCLFLYKIGNIEKALSYLKITRQHLAQPYVLYNGKTKPFGCMFYKHLFREKTLNEKFRMAVLYNIVIHSDKMFRELELEYRLSPGVLMIPPSVFTRMLLLLCHRGNPHKQQEVLYQLYFLLHHDDGRYVPEDFRDISWQILGICQQICGDHQGALLSYQESLRQIPFHYIQEATHIRMQTILHEI